MAERMSGLLRIAVALAALVCTAMGATVEATELRDPTRPPSAAVLAPQNGPDRTPATMGALTAIRIDAHQRVATIGGTRLKVGDRLGDGSVRAIRRTEVVLATPAGIQVLKLYPGVRQQAHGVNAADGARIAHAVEIQQSIRKPPDGGATTAPHQGEPK